MKYIFSLVLLFLFLFSCGTHKTPSGYYKNTPKGHLGLFELILFERGTYSLKYDGHMSSYESTGNWVKDTSNEICLTSEKQDENDFEVIENQELGNEIIIEVFEKKEQEILPGANIILYSKGKKRGISTSLAGLAEFYSADRIDSIEVSFIGYHTAMYTIRDSKSNRFIVALCETSMDYLFLKDEKLIVRGHKLLWPNESGSFLILKKQ
ncbi:hypothetical protein ACFO3O_10085 [Dokdonia ponticola]|uniref:Lipocalin-like domain-containing protein n=1 Tax=Dokdonia ponticola TaxID=2041041 RepID=A0ABV9HWR7_9FLAO